MLCNVRILTFPLLHKNGSLFNAPVQARALAFRLNIVLELAGHLLVFKILQTSHLKRPIATVRHSSIAQLSMRQQPIPTAVSVATPQVHFSDTGRRVQCNTYAGGRAGTAGTEIAGPVS